MPTPPPTQNLYPDRARVTDAYDGDTCTVDIDLGLNTWIRGEKYGRYLAEIWIEQQRRWINATDAMISAGHARLARYEPAHRHQTDFVSGRNTPRRVGVSRQGGACATPTGEYRVFLAELTRKEFASWQAGAGASATAGRNRARSCCMVP